MSGVVRTMLARSTPHDLRLSVFSLSLLSRAISWLTDEGLFVANLDLSNLKFADGSPAGRWVSGELRRGGLEYDRRTRLVICRGKRTITLPYATLGLTTNLVQTTRVSPPRIPITRSRLRSPHRDAIGHDLVRAHT